MQVAFDVPVIGLMSFSHKEFGLILELQCRADTGARTIVSFFILIDDVFNNRAQLLKDCIAQALAIAFNSQLWWKQ